MTVSFEAWQGFYDFIEKCRKRYNLTVILAKPRVSWWSTLALGSYPTFSNPIRRLGVLRGPIDVTYPEK